MFTITYFKSLDAAIMGGAFNLSEEEGTPVRFKESSDGRNCKDTVQTGRIKHEDENPKPRRDSDSSRTPGFESSAQEGG